jgi:hypothetical protein
MPGRARSATARQVTWPSFRGAVSPNPERVAVVLRLDADDLRDVLRSTRQPQP